MAEANIAKYRIDKSIKIEIFKAMYEIQKNQKFKDVKPVKPS